LPHHDQQASNDENQTEHERMLSSNMLPLILILLIDVTFSTPTPDYAQNPSMSAISSTVANNPGSSDVSTLFAIAAQLT
jgi:hypothetical protein